MLSLVSSHPSRSRTVCADQPRVRNLQARDGNLFVTSRLIHPDDELILDFWAVKQTISISTMRREPRRGTAQIALAVGAVHNKHKIAKYSDIDITDAAFSFARKTHECLSRKLLGL
jgi:hypothetical protein